MKRQIYLSMKTLEEARELFLSRFGPEVRTGKERIPSEEALDRVTAEPVFAKSSAPSFHSAAMDGIAVKAESTYGTTERAPKTLKVGLDAYWVNTGQPMPPECNAVIMVEKLHQIDENRLEIRSSAYPWQNVRKVGEDIVATELLFPQNHRIRAYDLGALIGAGVFSLNVWERPRVAVIPTGSELVSHRDLHGKEDLERGKIIEYNSFILSGLIRQAGGVPVLYGIVADEEEKVRAALRRAIRSDAHVVIINAGSSAGSRDYTVNAIRETGEVLVHGVAMMPGKPTILAVVEDKPVMGNPGYAVSATLSFEHFIKPLLYTLQGRRAPKPASVEVLPSRAIPSRLGLEEFVRVTIGEVGGRYVATPLGRAAGAISTLTRAEGILRIPPLFEGIAQEEPVHAELLVDEEDLRNTIVIIGSHDNTLDLLADEIRRKGSRLRISSANVGSLGGLIALRKGSCHMAGSHLLDAETGEYNLSYIRRYLKGLRVSVFHLVRREQGLIVPRGNPQNIKGIEDLPGSRLRFVNRQPGSGTRVLFDYKLRQLETDPSTIRGYDHEEFTHMAVAVDILSQIADCGMGIFAAAKALNLDFIPIEREQYDLVVPSSVVGEPRIQGLLEVVRSSHFRRRVRSLGGYDPSRSGGLWTEVGQDEEGGHA